MLLVQSRNFFACKVASLLVHVTASYPPAEAKRASHCSAPACSGVCCLRRSRPRRAASRCMSCGHRPHPMTCRSARRLKATPCRDRQLRGQHCGAGRSRAQTSVVAAFACKPSGLRSAAEALMTHGIGLTSKPFLHQQPTAPQTPSRLRKHHSVMGSALCLRLMLKEFDGVLAVAGGKTRYLQALCVSVGACMTDIMLRTEASAAAACRARYPYPEAHPAARAGGGGRRWWSAMRRSAHHSGTQRGIRPGAVHRPSSASARCALPHHCSPRLQASWHAVVVCTLCCSHPAR